MFGLYCKVFTLNGEHTNVGGDGDGESNRLFLLTGKSERFTGVVWDFELFKVLVLRDESMTKTVMDMVEKKTSAGPLPAISVESWQPKSGSEWQKANLSFCLTEVAAQSVSCVIQEGVFIYLPLCVVSVQLLSGPFLVSV